MTLYQDPIVWSDNRQLLGDSIKVYLQERNIREAHVYGNAFSVELMNDREHYNQVSSKTMHGYFVDGKIRWGEAVGNVLVVYYPIDDKDSTLIGLNYTETDTLRGFFSPERRLQKIWMPKAEGTLYPMLQIPAGKDKLPHFAWYDDIRPLNQYDLFRRASKKGGEKQYRMMRATLPEQELLDEKAKGTSQ